MGYSVERDVNLFSVPKTMSFHAKFDHSEVSFTIGDLHGNAMKLLHFLGVCGVIEFPTLDCGRSLYSQLLVFYQGPSNKIRVTGVKEKPVESRLMRCELFAKALHQCNVVKRPLLRFLGDTLCDRGKNDYFTLLVFEFLHLNNVPYEVLLSNHDIGFLRAYLDGFQLKQYMGPDAARHHQDHSLKTLIELMKNAPDEQSGRLTQHVNNIVKNAYLPYLKLFSYDLREHDRVLTVYSHAVVDLGTLCAAAEGFQLELGDFSGEEVSLATLAVNIDCINDAFNRVRENDGLKLFLEKLYFNRTVHGPEQLVRRPFYELAFARYLPEDAKLRLEVKFVHGHVGTTLENASFVHESLDSPLGKPPSKRQVDPQRRILKVLINNSNMSLDEIRAALRDSTPVTAHGEDKAEQKSSADQLQPGKMLPFQLFMSDVSRVGDLTLAEDLPPLPECEGEAKSQTP